MNSKSAGRGLTTPMTVSRPSSGLSGRVETVLRTAAPSLLAGLSAEDQWRPVSGCRPCWGRATDKRMADLESAGRDEPDDTP